MESINPSYVSSPLLLLQDKKEIMKTLSSILILLFPLLLMAQSEKEGQIQYKETIKFKIDLPDDMKQYAHLIPNEKVSQMVLFYDDTQSLYKASEKDNEAAPAQPQQSGVRTTIMTVGGGSTNQTYVNQKTKTIIRSENVLGQQFLIEDSLQTKPWKITDERKEILGYPTIKATLEKDSNLIVAWFSPALPVSIGPSNYFGLPGAVLETTLGSNNNTQSIIATKIEFKSIQGLIEKPKKGKKIDQESFNKLLQERLEEMKGSDGNGGSNIIIKTRQGNN